MIVLDASAVVELVLGTVAGRALGRRIADPRLELHCPHLVDVEVAQVIRRYVLAGVIQPVRGELALDHLQALDILRHEHAPLLPRIWALRHNLTAYDAAYVVLAEVLDAPLLTGDRRLARSSGHTARIEVI